MKIGTENVDDMFEAGRRLKECRKWRGMSREKLIECVEALPDNKGKTRSPKQISYIENGTRPLSSEYAFLLAQALNIRVEYLLLKDKYRTEEDRIHSYVTGEHDKHDLIISLLKLHNYNVTVTEGTVETDSSGKEFRKPALVLTSPKGSMRFLSQQEFFDILKNIDEYIDYQCASQFKKMIDGVRNIYDWEA